MSTHLKIGDYPLVPVGGDLPRDARATAEHVGELSAGTLRRREPGSRYLIRRELARGGMGVIYIVLDQDLQRITAMKVIAPHLADNQPRLHSFVREARITAQLEHPNIVPVHEIGVVAEHGSPFYTMKRVEGEGLHEIIGRVTAGDRKYQQRYTRHRLLDIFRKVCDAVAYAHSRGIIHRDIKPENIMVGPFGEVLLMDWGLAKHVGGPPTGSPTATVAGVPVPTPPGEDDDLAEGRGLRTTDGVIKGSLAYLSPEQAFGDLEQIDYQTDIFLLGATLYHLLTGHPPYEAEDLQEIIGQAEKCAYLPPSERQPAAQIPLALERIVLRAMAPLKASRYATVEQLTDDLDAFIAGKRVGGRRIFAPGEKLMEFGDESRDTFIIISGKVQVSRTFAERDIPIAVVGRGGIIGEMAGITHSARSATVVALTSTDTLVISHDLMMEELEKLPPWMERIIFSLAERVRALDDSVHPLLLKDRTFPVLNQLFCLFSVAWADARRREHVALPKPALIEEIINNLGIDRYSTVRILDVLLEARLCAATPDGLVSVPDPSTLRLFVDYCRAKFGVTGGLGPGAPPEILPEQDSYFRQVTRRLRAIYRDNVASPNSGDIRLADLRRAADELPSAG